MKPKQKTPRIVVYVEGGVVSGVMASIPVDVEVFDVDDVMADTELVTESGDPPSADDIERMYRKKTKGLKAVY